MASSDSSLEEENEKKGIPNRPLLKSVRKVGRPVGAPHRPYSNEELEVAFRHLLQECPPNVSGNKFLRGMQEEIAQVCKRERTISALQTLVKGKLRDMTPEMYNRQFRGERRPTAREIFFLREYMAGTKWQPPHSTRTKADGNADAAQLHFGEGSGNKKKGKLCESKEVSGPSSAQGRSSTSPPRNPFSYFKPDSASTPKMDAPPSSSINLQGYVKQCVAEYFEGFKVEAMEEVRRMIASKEMKRKRDGDESEVTQKRKMASEPGRDEDGSLTHSDSEEETEGHEELSVEVIKISDTSDDEVEERPGKCKRVVEFKTQKEVVGFEGDVEEEEAETNEAEMVSDDLLPKEQRVEKEAEEEKRTEETNVPVNFTDGLVSENQVTATDKGSASISQLLEDTTDKHLICVATDCEARERNASFMLSPLRARMVTLTLVEVFSVNQTEESGREGPSFRVVEEANGDLTLAHVSSVDQDEWSNNCVVDFHNSTLQEELESVLRKDIVQTCKEGPPLSPMTIEKPSADKRIFQTANLRSKGRVIRALFKRSGK